MTLIFLGTLLAKTLFLIQFAFNEILNLVNILLLLIQEVHDDAHGGLLQPNTLDSVLQSVLHVTQSQRGVDQNYYRKTTASYLTFSKWRNNFTWFSLGYNSEYKKTKYDTVGALTVVRIIFYSPVRQILDAWHQPVNVVLSKSASHSNPSTRAAVGKPHGKWSNGLIYLPWCYSCYICSNDPTHQFSKSRCWRSESTCTEFRELWQVKTIPLNYSMTRHRTILTLRYHEWTYVSNTVHAVPSTVSQNDRVFGRTCSSTEKPQLWIPAWLTIPLTVVFKLH